MCGLFFTGDNTFLCSSHFLAKHSLRSRFMLVHVPSVDAATPRSAGKDAPVSQADTQGCLEQGPNPHFSPLFLLVSFPGH